MNWDLGRTYLFVIFFDKQAVIGIPFLCYTAPVKVQPAFVLFAEGQNGGGSSHMYDKNVIFLTRSQM